MDTNLAVPLPARIARIPIFNPKGGVGKTTTTVNLGAALVAAGYRVVAFDLDPTAGLTSSLRCEWNPPPGYPELCLSAALVQGDRWQGDVRSLVFEHENGLHVVPTDPGMSNVLIALNAERYREFRLDRFLSRFDGLYDVALLDCPPNMDMLTDNALVAGRVQDGEVSGASASGPIIPVLPDAASEQALDRLLAQITGLSEELSIRIEPFGMVVNAYDKRDGLDVQRRLDTYREHPLGVLGVIGRLSAARKAWDDGRPVLQYAPDAVVSAQYRTLARYITGSDVA